MEVINSIKLMQEISESIRYSGKKIAVVPTMGYLHTGHLSLIRKAKEIADIVITTLFVNPTQFGPNEDYDKYPRDFNRDFELTKNNGSDYLFYPDTKEMYPINFSTSIDISKITEKFEGAFRPGHFKGVATVVAKLFNITKPHYAIFGQKDYQQTLVIKRLVEDLNFDIEIIIAPTIRDYDGLALSSRNTYLSTSEREKAGILFKAIETVKSKIAKGQRERLILNSHLHKTLRQIPEIKIDYASCAIANTLDEPEFFLPGDEVVILIACYLGKTRLIDNSIIKIPYSLNESNFKEDYV
jgi:pantoate--beta-alanine ligase